MWTSFVEDVLPNTNCATPEPAVNVVPLLSPLPPPTTSSTQLKNVVNIPGYSEVPVNIKKVLSICVMEDTPI